MKAVIGLGFGDEGKGLTTDFLCLQNPSATVIRFSGGHQAGHTVVHNGLRHVFSNFGSGTLSGNNTFISEHAIVSPINLYNEYIVLNEKGLYPKISIHDNCMITTPFDFYVNRDNRNNIKHGTCGMGIGSTVARNEAHQTLVFSDLKSSTILNIKLDLIAKYYGLISESVDLKPELDAFKQACNFLVKKIAIPSEIFIPTITDKIFEGSQGLLLDQNIGFFPHVTRANTGSKNLISMGIAPEYWLVTRAYQTRHGNGPMTNAEISFNIKSNPNETNVTNKYQGEFRKSMLDLNLLKYGLDRDREISRDNLVITCLDHLEEYKFTMDNEIINCHTKDNFINSIKCFLKCQNVYISESEESKNIIKY